MIKLISENLNDLAGLGFNLTSIFFSIILKILVSFTSFSTHEEFVMDIQKDEVRQNMRNLCKSLLQQVEMRSPLNIRGTAKEFGVDPSKVTDLQLYQHYSESGRDVEMREVNSDENYWKTGLRIDQDPRDLPPDQMEAELWYTFLSEHPGPVPTFVPPCLRERLTKPPCYLAGEPAICMKPDHPACRFQTPTKI